MPTPDLPPNVPDTTLSTGDKSIPSTPTATSPHAPTLHPSTFTLQPPPPSLTLVTGSAGCIGQAVIRELLARGVSVRGFDRVPTPGLPGSHVGDLTDAAALRRAAEGAQNVIHLAATPDDADFMTEILPNNIIGLHHVLEATRLAGARRLVLASTGQVNWWQRERTEHPIHPDEPTTPRYWYAAAKVFAEGIGQGYAVTHGLSVIAVRLGWCPRPGQENDVAALDWAKDLYLSPGDAGRFFHAAICAPLTIRYAVVYATSRHIRLPRFDLGPTKALLGWEPRDQWPDGLA
ncbi:MAG: NAD(P)-dependent oxidoreductase [Verrucomicrobia bacterium]|nr:NAD(P)-dependent oxidoreductase [Verrucomicrobiota bacterium]